MYAIIETGGKQYQVAVGDIVEIEKLEGEAGTKVDLKAIMTVDGETVLTGSAVKAKVAGEIVKTGRGKKIVIFKYKAKKNVRVKKGHRQYFTKVKITSIA